MCDNKKPCDDVIDRNNSPKRIVVKWKTLKVLKQSPLKNYKNVEGMVRKKSTFVQSIHTDVNEDKTCSESTPDALLNRDIDEVSDIQVDQFMIDNDVTVNTSQVIDNIYPPASMNGLVQAISSDDSPILRRLTTIERNKYIRLKELLEILGVKRSTVYDWMNKKSSRYISDFPEKIHLSNRAVAWRLVDVIQWLESRSTKGGV